MARCKDCDKLMNWGDSYGSFRTTLCGKCHGKRNIKKLKDKKELAVMNYNNLIEREKRRWQL